MTDAIYVINGKEYPFSIRENLELKKRFLCLGDEKIFDTFNRGCNILNSTTTFNDIDITENGRKLFNIPDNYNNHFVRVSIRA